MEHFVSTINALLAIKPKQGALLLLVGGGVLFLNDEQFAPFASIATGWLAVAGVAVLVGAAILLLSLGGRIIDWITAKTDATRADEASRRREAMAADEALANINVLTAPERVCLLWILDEGKERFQADPYDAEVIGLSRKNILGLDGRSVDRRIFVVHPAVWAERKKILESLTRNTRKPGRAPWDLGFGSW